MTKEFRQTIFYSSIYLFIYLLSIGILYISFKEIKMTVIIPISTIIAYILSPKFKQVEMQSGMKYQVKWIFMKKTILISI